ncbi:MAG TPA: hypothetical protein VN538_12725 [Clostridia bacterium]|nr:hypothetical protein [Clostridia bacterium]
MNITDLVLIALFIEAIINAIKPIWDKTAKKLTAAEIISMALGVIIAVIAKINLLSGAVSITDPALIYLLYVMTGVALGRGPSFIYDLWKKIRAQQTSK